MIRQLRLVVTAEDYARLEGPGGLQLTLFQELDPDSALGAGGSAAGASSKAE